METTSEAVNCCVLKEPEKTQSMSSPRSIFIEEWSLAKNQEKRLKTKDASVKIFEAKEEPVAKVQSDSIIFDAR